MDRVLEATVEIFTSFIGFMICLSRSLLYSRYLKINMLLCVYYLRSEPVHAEQSWGRFFF